LQAQSELGEYFLAERDLKEALLVEPDNADVKRQMARVKKLQGAQDKKDKAMYSAMFK